MLLRGTLPFTASGSSTGIGGIARAAVDPQRLVDAGDEEDQSDTGPYQQVADRIDPIVAEPVGDQQRLVVEHVDKAGGITLWRGVAAARRIRRGDDEKR
jgi:hypothetical protein